MSLKIALVVPRRAPDLAGGAERLAREYAAALHPAHDLTVLTTCARDHVTWRNELPAGETTDGGMRVIRFPVDARDSECYAQLQQRIARGETLSAEEERAWQANGCVSSALVAHLQATAYDRSIGMPYLFGVVQQALLVAPEKAVLVPCLHPEPHAQLGLVRDLFARAGTVLFNAPEEKTLAEEYYGALPSFGDVIGMGLDFQPDAPDFPPPADYLLYLGRLEAGKGTHLLAAYFHDYCRAHPESALRLVMAGGGDFPRFPALAGRLEVRGWTSEAEKEQLLRGALALVQPSALESLSIVTLEAWRQARPVLVNGRSAVQRGNVERSGGGLHYDDSDTFGRALHCLATRPAEAAAWGRRGWSYLRRHHDPSRVAQRLRDALVAHG